MAEITPLRFKKDTSWEGENELPEYYTDADKRAGLLDLMSKINAEGKYIFDSKTWEDHRKEYTELLAAYRKAEDDYSKWKSEQEAKGIKATQYLQDDKASEFRVAINERETELNSRFSEEKQRILNSNNPEVSLNLLQVYGEVEKDLAAHPELKEKFADLERIVDNMLEGDKDSGKDKSNLNLQYKDGQLLLRVDNLGGSGLKFAIKDDLSIVFTENQTLTKEQVQEFAKFFDEMGMSIDNFSPTDKLKVVEDNNESKEVGSFENIFKSYSRAAWRNMDLEELRRIQKENEDNGISNPALDDIIAQKTAEEEYAGQDYDANGQTGQTDEIGGADTPSHEGNPFADYLKEKDKDISLRKMKEKILARGGIMRVDPRCIATRRMPDGSMVISFYNSEQDKMNDGKLDKDGIAKHTKKCAFRMWNSRPPRIGIYVPQGAKFETAYAKGALGAMKACGYDYFFLPSTPEFGGDAQSAFLEAAGDQLVCPRLKRSPDDKQGCDLGPEHIRIIMKALMDSEKSNKSSAEEMIKFKMRLVGELDAYITNVKPNDDKLMEERDKIESDIRLEMYTTATFPALTSFIEKGINGELKDANGNPVKWDRVDLACAYEALGRISEGISNGQIKYDYLHGNSSEQMLQLLGAEMNKCRAEVVNEFNNKFNKGGEDNNEEPENRTNSRLKTSSGEALAVYEDRMNKRFEKISKKGSDFAKKLKFSNKEKSIDAPSYDKQTKKIINRPIPGIAQTNTPTQTRGGNGR